MQISIPKSAARRGVSVVFTVVGLSVLLGFAALAIDVGYAYSVRSQLQRNADAAALAGASVLISDNLLSEIPEDPTPQIIETARDYAWANPAGGVQTEILLEDIVPGNLPEPYNPEVPVVPSAYALYNAVQVTSRRTDSINGEIALFFARTLGVDSISLSATATAYVENRFSGYRPPPVNHLSPLLPFTIHRTIYQTNVQEGGDLFGYNSNTRQITAGPDGIVEIRLYPAVGDVGNFGTLNIGIGNQGTQQLGSQIEFGLNEGDLADEIGTENISFLSANGFPVTYTITGNPGISGGLVSYLEARLGDVVGFFIHIETTESGSNYEYQIVDIRFGRLLEVDLTGNPENKRLVVQPVVYSDPGVETDPRADSSDGMVVALRLVR